MTSPLPRQLYDAIEDGTWHDRGPDALRVILGTDEELELFVTEDKIAAVKTQVQDGGFVEDPTFCMVRDEDNLSGDNDDRLVFAQCVFIAGSVQPGDDVLVALDLRSCAHDPNVLLFDWGRPAQSRWVMVGRLSELIERLRKYRSDTPFLSGRLSQD